MDDMMTTREAAEYLGIDHRTVRGWVQRGILPIARRITPRLSLVRRADIERLRANPPRPGPKPARVECRRGDAGRGEGAG